MDLVKQGMSMGVKKGITIIVSMAGALKGLHRRGWSHGDLKPGNMLLMEDGVRCKIADMDGSSMAGASRSCHSFYVLFILCRVNATLVVIIWRFNLWIYSCYELSFD